MKLEKFSQAHVVAKASCSIYAYQRSVSNMNRDANEIGFHALLDCWSRTAPRPCEDASAEALVGALGS